VPIQLYGQLTGNKKRLSETSLHPKKNPNKNDLHGVPSVLKRLRPTNIIKTACSVILIPLQLSITQSEEKTPDEGGMHLDLPVGPSLLRMSRLLFKDGRLLLAVWRLGKLMMMRDNKKGIRNGKGWREKGVRMDRSLRV
jgi:hypothetical protein